MSDYFDKVYRDQVDGYRRLEHRWLSDEQTERMPNEYEKDCDDTEFKYYVGYVVDNDEKRYVIVERSEALKFAYERCGIIRPASVIKTKDMSDFDKMLIDWFYQDFSKRSIDWDEWEAL